MNNWNGVSRDWVKYPIYFVGFILMCFAIVILSSYNNAGKRQRCEAQGGTFIENEFESHLSMCVYGKVG
jgi:cbb3-type cytochrome oxidase subunit 3